MLGHILRHIRVVTKYMGSGIKGLHWVGSGITALGSQPVGSGSAVYFFIYLFIYLLNSITQMINIKIKNKFKNKR